MDTSKTISTFNNNAQRNSRAILWALLAVGIFSFIYISGKLTGGTVSAFQIIWLRYIGGFITVVVLLFLRRENLQSIATHQVHVHFFRAAAGGGSGVAAIYAAVNMPVAHATAIGLLDGFFVVLLGIIVLHEVVSLRQWIAALLCLLGAAISVFGKGFTLDLHTSMLLPASVALVGAMLVAIESILIKMLARSESTLIVLFYVNFFGAILFALPGLWYWHATSFILVLTFVALGPLAIIAQSCNIMALRLADVSLIGPVRYSWIIFGALFGFIFFAEQPNISTYVGGVLILLSGAWLATLRAQTRGNQSQTNSD